MQKKQKPFVIGLTGGIGSGKTTVTNLFSDLNIEVIDADVISKQAVTPGTAIYTKIIERLGPDYQLPNGNLDRKNLRELTFRNREIRQWLESMIHPFVRATMQEAIKHIQSPYCILVIPLLIETLPNALIDEILVVTADQSTRIQRIIERDHCSSETAKKMIAAQLSEKERLKHADQKITNNGSIDELKQAVKELHQHYLSRLNG